MRKQYILPEMNFRKINVHIIAAESPRILRQCLRHCWVRYHNPRNNTKLWHAAIYSTTVLTVELTAWLLLPKLGLFETSLHRKKAINTQRKYDLAEKKQRILSVKQQYNRRDTSYVTSRDALTFSLLQIVRSTYTIKLQIFEFKINL